MGIFKDRTDWINSKIASVSNEVDKRLLSNGFIPESLQPEYNSWLHTRAPGLDEDIDKISNANYFALIPGRVAGKMVAGTGFLNPVLVKGNIDDVLTSINAVIGARKKTTAPISEETKAEPVSDKIGSDKKEETQKTKQMKKPQDIKPEVPITKKDIAVIVSKGLLNDDTNGQKVQDTAQTIGKYNPLLTEDQIKAWVYHKRKFGNPMKGWEKYFISGGKNSNILLQTIKDTTVKDNKYADLRTIPANTIIGAKTKFKNTYGTETLVICKTAQGELLWINVKDVKEITNNTGESQSEIDRLVKEKALVFDGNEYYPYPVYLFGNIYEKIDILNENKELIVTAYGEALFNEQLEKVKKYVPAIKSFRDPVKGNRPHILSLSQFALDTAIFGVMELNEETGIKMGATKRGRFQAIEEKVSLYEAYQYWFDEFVKDIDLKNTTKANIKKYYFAKSISWPKDETGKDVLTNAQKEELIGNARIAAEDLFSDFLATALTFEDAVALDAVWNKKYNAYTNVIQFVDEIPIGFHGSTMFKDGELGVKPAQRQGLAYLQLTGSGCLAYDVGFGKTLTGILNIAQLLSQGAIKRPLVVVPKPTYKNWLRELFGYWTDGERVDFNQFEGAVYHYGVFSGVENIKVNDWYNLSGKHYERLLAKNNGDINKLVAENSITVVSYKGFEQMGFSRDISQDMFDHIASVLMQKETMENMKEKELAGFYQKVQGWLGLGNKNAIVTVDKCGFDHITVDEAHNFKNVFPSCGKDPATGRKLFNISAGQSTRAVKMYFITNYIQSKYGKRVALLTATPFTNSPLEMYSMLSFIGLETLNAYNLFNIKKFFEQFILETIEYAVDAKGEIITKPVIKSFKNVKLLQTILYNHFHYKDNPKEAGVVRPCRIDLPNAQLSTYLEMNEWQTKNQALVKTAAKSVSRSNPGAVLKAINMSLNNAFSPYLYEKSMNPEGFVGPDSSEEFVNNSPKIKYAIECVRTVKEWHEGRGEECSGIILYSNRGKEFFGDIQEYLNDFLGFKRKVIYDDEELNEVEQITGGGGEADEDRKELIKDAFNAGVVKVIIGTGTIREGINLQKRSAVTIDLYPEWNPTDIQQLKGRNWRQGNIYGYVRFVMPLVINSMDGFIQQKLDEKSKRIANLWELNENSNVIENENELDPAEIKYALVDDAQEKFKMKFDTQKAELERSYQVLLENKKVLSEIEYSINQLKDSEQDLFDSLTENKTAWVEYVNYLRKLDLKDLKEKDLAKTVTSIERAIKNTTELIDALNTYTAARFDMPKFLEMLRMIKQRDFKVFTDYSFTGKEIDSKVRDIIGWGSFDIREWTYNRLVSAYSAVRKAEKSVLNAYGKNWNDDISDISTEVDKRIEELKATADMVQSEEFKQQMINEIENEMARAREVRGDLNEQVAKFASLNHLLSYLSDNTDKENCPIPFDVCCPTTGITIVHQDKEMREPIETVTSSELDMQNESIQQELREAIATIEEVLPDLEGDDLEEAKYALETCKELLNEPTPPKGPKGPKRGSKESFYIEFLNKDKKFQKDKKHFDTEAEATKWGKKNLPNFNIDMIHRVTVETPEPAKMDETRSREIAAEIREQLGSMALKMMGAHDMYADNGDLVFKIKGSKKWKHIRIHLNGLDLYDITFTTWRKDKKTEHVVNDIYNDQLHDIIERETGLYTRLKHGGPVDRSKPAINKDHKYYNDRQDHERRYAAAVNRRKVRYKLAEGGPADLTELERGLIVEEEHRETLEKLAAGLITVDQAVQETAEVHLLEDPNYYTKIQEIEGQLKNGGPVNQPLCPVGTKIQTLMFDKDKFSKEQAQDWTIKHDLMYGIVDDQPNTWRIRQRNLQYFKQKSFRTIELTEGVKAVIGCPKK